MLIMETMNNSAHLPVSQSAAHPVPKTKARRGRPRKNGLHANSRPANDPPRLAAAGSLTRTKALLLAALRVWELKHRVGE